MVIAFLRANASPLRNFYGSVGKLVGLTGKLPRRKVILPIVLGKHEIEIWGDGTQTRSFMYIDDCATGNNRFIHIDICSRSISDRVNW